MGQHNEFVTLKLLSGSDLRVRKSSVDAYHPCGRQGCVDVLVGHHVYTVLEDLADLDKRLAPPPIPTRPPAADMVGLVAEPIAEGKPETPATPESPDDPEEA
jgi:hypothetical protein